MKKVYFLCYSRYGIFVAYLLRKALHQNDESVLIISDDMSNEDNISEHIRNTGLWDEVILFREKGQEPAVVGKRVNNFVNSHEIDCFYVAHIMRCASHFFTKYLHKDTEINVFDEGTITMDLLGNYNLYTRSGLRTGWVEFEFARVNNIYSFFAMITKPFGKAVVKQIEMKNIINTQFVEELNQQFDYAYKQEKIDVLYVDTNGASAGLYTKEYEQYCINNVLEYINTEKCYIKIKPSESKKVIQEKYGKYNVRFIHGGMVPFEVIYLNMIKSGCFPKLIITVSTTMIWNMLLINQAKHIDMKMILLLDLMSECYIDEHWRIEELDSTKKYLQCLNCEDKVYLPKDWGELYAIFEKYKDFFKMPKKDEWKERELVWFKRQYMKLLREEKYVTKPRFLTLHKWVDSLYQGKAIANYFEKRNIHKIIMYGIGYYGDIFLKAMRGTRLNIELIIVTNISEPQFMVSDIQVCSLDSYKEKKEQYPYPILITAVGKDNEIKEILDKNKIDNEIILFKDIIDKL